MTLAERLEAAREAHQEWKQASDALFEALERGADDEEMDCLGLEYMIRLTNSDAAIEQFTATLWHEYYRNFKARPIPGVYIGQVGPVTRAFFKSDQRSTC